jgi:uroporphyrinogen-III synthase/uroporphyrinogen III methyltransferase/synthase
VQPDSLKVATVGEGTAKAAAGAGLKVSFVPGSYIAEGLVSGLQGHAPGARILLARAAVARDVIPDAMRAAGALVEVVDAYRNGIPVRAPGELKRALADGLDAAMFSSSSSVTHLKAAAVAGGLMWPFAGVAAISIGPITSSTLREEGWEPAAEAQVSDIPGLVKAICQYFAPMSAGN